MKASIWPTSPREVKSKVESRPNFYVMWKSNLYVKLHVNVVIAFYALKGYVNFSVNVKLLL